jgi:hypothetical protein
VNQSEMTSLAEQVARHLDGAWSVEPFPDDWGRHGAWLRGERGESLSIGETQEYSKRNKNLLDVGTDYPKEHGERGFSTRRPRISVSASKSGRQIASDIARRLLPDYLPLLEKVLSDLSERRSYENATSKITSLFASLAQVPAPKNDETTVSFYHSPYPVFRETQSEVRVVDPHEVELRLRLTPEEALEVLKDILASGRSRG